MLKKIKKFKISLRPSFALRHLKKKLQWNASESEAMEKKINEEIVRLQKSIVPSAVYESYSKEETPPFLKPLWENVSDRSLSLSLILTTIGAQIEQETEKSRNESDEIKLSMVDSIGREALEQSLNFVLKLLGDEAKLESCELSPAAPLHPEFIKETLALLESQKAEISVDDQGLMNPLYTSVNFCFWNPLSKNKNGKNR